MKTRRFELILLIIISAGLVWTGWSPYDRFTWWLETAPIWLGLPLLLLTARRFRLTPMLYFLITVHALILMIGGKYTYARVPAGDWVRDWLQLSRNPYDRLGHLAQGFIPVILTREILLRTSPLQRGKWLAFLSVCVCLAFSAFYELIEMATALASGARADDFLGTQGDPWDTQWDMACALLGALAGYLILHRLHDRQLHHGDVP
jgi:putative membrane protein